MRTIDEIQELIREAQRKPDVEAIWALVAELQAMGTDRALAEATAASGLACSISGRHGEAVEHFVKALDQFTRLRIDSKVASVLTMMALEQAEIGQIPEAMASFSLSLEMCTTPDLARLKAVATGDMGILFMRLGDYPSALEQYDRAIVLYEAAGDRSGTGNVLGNIGNVYFVNGEYAKAVEHHQRSIEVYEEFNDVKGLARATMNVAIAQAMAGDHAAARPNLERALQINRELGYEIGIQGALLNLTELLITIKETDQAAVLLDELTSMHVESFQLRAGIHALRAQIMQARGQLDDAVAELDQALHIATEGRQKRDQLNIHRALRDIALAKNDLAEYVKHNDAFQQISEEIHGKETNQRLAMMEARKQMDAERQEREKERALLYGALPEHIATRMLRGQTIDDQFENAAVLFADIVGFTTHSSSMLPSETVKLLEELFNSFDALCELHEVTKVKTIGDSYLCFAENAENITSVALAMAASIGVWPDGSPLQFRIGIHAGPVSAGVIGTQRLQYDIWGDTVNTASRMESSGEPGKIHVSEAFADNVAGENILPGKMVKRGEIEIKGKGPMTTYWLEGARHRVDRSSEYTSSPSAPLRCHQQPAGGLPRK